MKSLLSSQNELKSDQVSRSKDQSIAHQGLRGKKKMQQAKSRMRETEQMTLFFFFFKRKRKKFKRRNQLIGFRDIAIQSNQRPLFQPGLTIFKKKKKKNQKGDWRTSLAALC